MNTELFLKIPNVPGGSTDPQHRDEIELSSFEWGLSRSVEAGASPTATELSVVFAEGRASLSALLACAAGRTFRDAALSMRIEGESADYKRYTLQNVLVTSYATSGATGAGPFTDSMTLSFSRVVVATFAVSGFVAQRVTVDFATGQAS